MTTNKVIDSILLAEHKADEILVTAREDSLKCLSVCEATCEKIKAQSEIEYKDIINKATLESEAKFKQAYESKLEEYQARANSLIEDSQGNIDKAVEKIIKRIK